MAQTDIMTNDVLNARRRLPGLHSPVVAWGILFASLLLTAVACFLSNQYIRKRAEDRFHFRVSEVVEAVQERMLEYVQVLRAGVGFFGASDEVTREDWKIFIASLELGESFPGIQGVGYAELVKRSERNAYEEKLKREGFPNFKLRPDGERPLYSVVTYLEPFDWRNQRAFGYDMYSESTRRSAMEHAIRNGSPAISGVVTLVQETNNDVQPGFLVYVPLYERGKTHSAQTVNGFVYAPFRTKDLMHGILKSDLPDIDFEVYDGAIVSTSNMLFDSNQVAHSDKSNGQAEFATWQQLELHGRTWTLHFESQAGFKDAAEGLLSWFVAGCGLIVDLALFLTIRSIGKQRRLAIDRAEEFASAYESTRRQFQAVCDTACDPILIVNDQMQIIYHNSAAETLFRFTSQEFQGMQLGELLANERVVTSNWPLDLSARSRTRCIRKDEHVFPADISVSQWNDGPQSFSAVVVQDVTLQVDREETIQRKVAELESTNSELDNFAYIASHDLRSPLRGIGLLADWIGEDAGNLLPDESKENLGLMIQQTKRMERLLDDLLRYSRVGRVKEQHSTVDSGEIVREIVDVLHVPDGISVSIAENMPELKTARSPLLTCLRNLISNAIGHHDKPTGKVHVSAESSGRFIRFIVTDDGPGIDPRFHERIFGIFQTLKPKDGTDHGSGIGLAIIKKTAESYGGSIELQSKVREGTTFILSWPIS